MFFCFLRGNCISFNPTSHVKNNGGEHLSVFDVTSAPSSKKSNNQGSNDYNFNNCLKRIRSITLIVLTGQLNISLIRNFLFLHLEIVIIWMHCWYLRQNSMHNTFPTAPFSKNLNLRTFIISKNVCVSLMSKINNK